MADALLIGVDAGGTSTKALALDLKTGERRTARAEGANWTVHGPDLCRERLGAAVSEAAAGRPIHSLALCIAGYFPPDHAEAANAWARAAWPDVSHLSIQPDVHAAWAGAFGGEPGIVVISGTGSIAYGRNVAGKEARAGGWGPLFSDEGSAYQIGLRTLHMAASYADWSGLQPEPDELYRVLMERWPELGSDLVTWLRGIYRARWEREQIAELGGFVAQQADCGQPSALTVMAMAARDLVELAEKVNFNLKIARAPVALQGGIGGRCSYLQSMFARLSKRLRLGFELRPPLLSGLEGAVILAASAGGRALSPRVLLE